MNIHNHQPWITRTFALLIIAATPLFGFAASFSNSPSTCTQYVSNYSDEEFISLVSTNTSTASAIAQTLSVCQIANTCATINDDRCAAILAAREFESTYYANFSDSTALNHTLLKAAQPMGVKYNYPIKDSDPKQNTTSVPNKQPKTNNVGTSSVNWL